MIRDPESQAAEELNFQQYLDQLPAQYLEAEYPNEYRHRDDWWNPWLVYGVWH